MAEKEGQTYQSHRRLVWGFHGVTFLLIVVFVGWSAVRLFQAPGVATGIQLGFAVGVQLLFFYTRQFAITVQDRVIRLEERLRLARILPADLQPQVDRLTPGQLIGLRFAVDAEVPELVRRVAAGELSGREDVKRAIKTWRPDYLRA
ncbi:MAG: DUF6526 family protein [Gemmatimonadota bacterium]|nr:DUF6526 family protein [Gemmatimonadota bacterium]